MTSSPASTTRLLCGLLTMVIFAGCVSPPEGDDVLVLRAGDYVGIPDDPQVHEPLFHQLTDSTGILFPDSIPFDSTAVIIPDSTSLLPDSALADSLPEIVPELPAGLKLLAVEIRGSLYGSLQGAEGIASDVLGAHCVRYLWWDLNPWTGLIAGDSLRILYTTQPGSRENTVTALRYIPLAGSANSAFSVYVFHKTGDNYPSAWYSNGTEVVRLLNRMPLSTFEEVTGIFGEVRGSGTHHGVDFKAPTGVPVRTTLGGRVNRMDWNPEYNGRCVEIDFCGYREVFLHLDEVSEGISTGRTVEQGAQIGTVGNTGRSYASHLHYQINDPNDNPVDPYIYLGSRRRSLEGDELLRFQTVRDSLDTLLRGV